MQFSELEKFSAQTNNHPSSFFSEALRLRANYLIYCLNREMTEEEKRYIEEAQIPWAEYKNLKTIEAIVSFLRSIGAGLYMPHLSSSIIQENFNVCLYLLDPHLVDDFEYKISNKRLGVLIRRPILASLHFREVLAL